MKYIIPLCLTLILIFFISSSNNTSVNCSVALSKKNASNFIWANQPHKANTATTGLNYSQSIPIKKNIYKSSNFLSGTFIQPDCILKWNYKDYDSHFKEYKALGFDHIVLQWAEYYDPSNKTLYTYYPSKLSKRKLKKDLLTPLLKYGQKYNIEVYIGLNMNEQWWDTISKSPDQFELWWKKEALQSITLTNDIWDKYKRFALSDNFSSFGGWYIPFEIDNLAFYSVEKQNVLSKHLSLITNHIKQTSDLPILLAPFFYRSTEILAGIQHWEKMWVNILSKTDIDIITLQDGIGCKRDSWLYNNSNNSKSIDSIGKWFNATKEAIKKSSKKVELWADLETFTEDNNNRFSSAPLDRIIRQLNAESPHVTKFTSFSFQAYQDFDKDKRAFERYKEYVNKIRNNIFY